MKISQIIDKIDDKQLFVPAFQREYVWKRKNAKDLISSLIKDYPTGTMLTWETSNPPELKGDHEYDSRQGAVKLILDGQQRITTLYMLMTGNIPPYYKEHEILMDIRNLHVNVETLALDYYMKKKMDNDPLWVNITDIFQANIRYRDVIDQLENQADGERISRDREDIIDDHFRAIERIKDRDFQEQIIPTKANIKEAIDIFYIVNASGVNLTDAELALAQISGYWPEARELFKNKLIQLAEDGFVFRLDHIIYMLLGVLFNSGTQLEKLHDSVNKDKIKEAWSRLDGNILDYVFNIMRSQAYVDHTKEVNSVFAFIPIIVYVFNKDSESLSESEIKKVIKWFYYSQIRNRYVSSTQQKLDKDLGIVVNEINPFDKLLNLIEADRKLEIHKDEFIGSGVSHPLWGLMRFYFKSKEAVCLTTGIHIRKNMGKKYELEWDHIFPYSVLKENGYGQENRIKYSYAQEITNRAVLTQTANRKKTNHPARDYLESIVEKFPNSLKLQCIPEDKVLWSLDNFEDFLERRRVVLADELNNFLENITDTNYDSLDVDVADMISSGENSQVEFKTTLRYDMREHKLNKKLEEVILKTIGAFSNAQGGHLIMGVDDDLHIIGLENDYRTLKEPNKDEFELHLRNIINTAYGIEFGANHIVVKFPIVNDIEICIVEIKPGLKPLYTEMTNKNGVKTKHFYVRSGNSSQAIDLTEVASYINNRFN